mmetsp:Transcript_37040/g.69239  ORF Transcript_37040/g.69239 Transcript_37040/m.69239 type:complete len:214 (-) Transcript_37040:1014-1655(-)
MGIGMVLGLYYRLRVVHLVLFLHSFGFAFVAVVLDPVQLWRGMPPSCFSIHADTRLLPSCGFSAHACTTTCPVHGKSYTELSAGGVVSGFCVLAAAGGVRWFRRPSSCWLCIWCSDPVLRRTSNPIDASLSTYPTQRSSTTIYWHVIPVQRTTYLPHRHAVPIPVCTTYRNIATWSYNWCTTGDVGDYQRKGMGCNLHFHHCVYFPQPEFHRY